MTQISIMTKTGDKGESGLANGQRLGKDQPVFEVVGTLDEVNSWLGLVAAKLHESFAIYKEQLYTIQDTLFYIGAEVAGSPKAKLAESAIQKLEGWAVELQEQMADNWHTQFLLPGGTELGGYLDITRTVCRRCERVMVTFANKSALSPALLKYINRLSDYIYLLRCFVNQQEMYQEKKFVNKG